MECNVHFTCVIEGELGILVINTLARCVDDDRRAESRVQRLAEPEANLVGRHAQDSTLGGIRPQQDGVRFTGAWQKKR